MTKTKWIKNNNTLITFIGDTSTQFEIYNIEKFKKFLQTQEGITTIFEDFQINVDNIVCIQFRFVDDEVDSSENIPESEVSQ